jgi:hypothetical protein
VPLLTFFTILTFFVAVLLPPALPASNLGAANPDGLVKSQKSDDKAKRLGRLLDLSKLYSKGYLKNETSLHTHSPHDATKIKNIFQLELKYTFNDNLKLFTLGRVFWDADNDIEDDNDLESWEIYLDLRLKDMDLRVGRQQVVWGEADGLRINDIINPQDFKEFILQDYIDSRIPLWMAKIDYYLGDFTFEGLIIPEFKRNRFPRGGSEWEFYQPSLPPLFRLTRHNNKKPAHSFENWEWGLRVFKYLKGWDLSASYFYTWDDFPTFHRKVKLFPENLIPTIELSPRHHRLHVFGFTYNKAAGPFILRGEGGYYLNKYLETTDPQDGDGVKKRDYIYYMLGSDYHVIHNVDLSFQFIQKVITHYDNHFVEENIQNSLSLFIRTDFLHETLKPALLLIYETQEGDFWISPKVSYDINDRIQVTLGGEFFEGGDRQSFFGQFNSNDQIYCEIKYSFDF